MEQDRKGKDLELDGKWAIAKAQNLLLVEEEAVDLVVEWAGVEMPKVTCRKFHLTFFVKNAKAM